MRAVRCRAALHAARALRCVSRRAAHRLTHQPRPTATPRQVFAAGAAAKLLATLATYPFLVIKSRQQARRAGSAVAGSAATGAAGDGSGAGDAEGSAAAAPSPPLGPLAEAWALAREEGLSGLYRGLDTKVVQTVLAAAILFTTKEQVTAATRRALAAGRRK
jgi:adenine nucleotide transporter 17